MMGTGGGNTGKKKVKGSSFPRAYYKCMHRFGSVKCSVKKMVERTSKDTTLNIYEGIHTHDSENDSQKKKTAKFRN